MGRNALGILDWAFLLRQYFVSKGLAVVEMTRFSGLGVRDSLECGAPAALWY